MKKIDTPVYVVDDDASVASGGEPDSLGWLPGAHVWIGARNPGNSAGGHAELSGPDLHLPGLSGLELQRELARDDVQIPIIFLTGQATSRPP